MQGEQKITISFPSAEDLGHLTEAEKAAAAAKMMRDIRQHLEERFGLRVEFASASPTSLADELGQADETPDVPFVVRPWPYLCAMANMAVGAFLHPFQTTVVDLETGGVVDRD